MVCSVPSFKPSHRRALSAALRMGEDYLLGGDHYYLIDMDCDGVPHPDAKFPGVTEELAEALRWAFDEPGPHLIEAVMPSIAG